MITEGQIIRKISDNTYEVRIFIFEAAGENEEKILPCHLCVQPNVADPYKIGDRVYVSFVNNEINKPVIIGKIYNPDTINISTTTKTNSLVVIDSTNLSENTIIGSISYGDLLDMMNRIKILEDKVNQLTPPIYSPI